jgi:hypothetical protein
MKHQYFGDINDFHKYGLLYILCSERKFRLGVCWMLTPNDGRNDGSRTRYLLAPERWRAHNPQLFDFLGACVKGSKTREVTLIESRKLLPMAQFYCEILTDSANQRRTYFSKMRQQFANADLIFFDPDNGLEVESVSWGARKSSKYVYLRELSDVYRAGHSLLVYQHFRREKRSRFVATLAAVLKRSTGALDVYSFSTAHVVFFLAPQKKHMAYVRRVAASVEEIWAGQFTVCHHPPEDSDI